MSDPTKGAAPLIAETPTVTINGRTYKLRRLGVQDTFRLARIIGVGATQLGKELGDIRLDKDLEQSVLMLLMAGFPFAERQVLELLASLIGVSYEEITNPELFPMGSELEIVRALAEHQDLKAFFSKLAALLMTPGVAQTLKSSSSA